MNILSLQIVLIAGVLYGLISLVIELKRKAPKHKNQLGLGIALIIAGTAAFLMTFD